MAAGTAQGIGSKRVIVVIDRGMTDKTPKVVWSHEIPLLKAIHGNAEVVAPEDLCDVGMTAAEKAAYVRDQKRALCLGYVFDADIAEEYARLTDHYGMHPDVPVPVVQHVYGLLDEGRFAKAVANGSLEDMPIDQLRQLCGALQIEFTNETPAKTLVAELKKARRDGRVPDMAEA